MDMCRGDGASLTGQYYHMESNESTIYPYNVEKPGLPDGVGGQRAVVAVLTVSSDQDVV